MSSSHDRRPPVDERDATLREAFASLRRHDARRAPAWQRPASTARTGRRWVAPSLWAGASALAAAACLGLWWGEVDTRSAPVASAPADAIVVGAQPEAVVASAPGEAAPDEAVQLATMAPEPWRARLADLQLTAAVRADVEGLLLRERDELGALEQRWHSQLQARRAAEAQQPPDAARLAAALQALQPYERAIAVRRALTLRQVEARLTPAQRVLLHTPPTAPTP